MRKYTLAFKLAVVKKYLSGEAGYTTLARQYDAPRSLIRRWVLYFQQHGSGGLAKKVGRYDATFRKSVLEHMWENGLSNIEVAAHFNIRSHSAIGVWERAYLEKGLNALITRPQGRPRKMPEQKMPEPPIAPEDGAQTREELLAEVKHLRMELAVLKKLEALAQSKRAALRKKRK